MSRPDVDRRPVHLLKHLQNKKKTKLIGTIMKRGIIPKIARKYKTCIQQKLSIEERHIKVNFRKTAQSKFRKSTDISSVQERATQATKLRDPNVERKI